MKAYISGPMSGRPWFNFPLFDDVADHLRSYGHEAVNPADHDREVYPDIEKWDGFATGDVSKCHRFDLRAAMAWDLEQVTKCDWLVLLPGWEDSKGARHERYVAEVTGKKIYLADVRNGMCFGIHLDPLQQRVTSSEWRAPTVTPMSAENGQPTEVRVTDPTTGGQKGQKLQRFDLLPVVPLRQIAEVYGLGARKYADRNWEKGYAWSLSYGAMMRHLNAWWSGEDNDPELGTCHLANAGFHILALLEFMRTHPEKDDRVKEVASDTRRAV